MKYFFFLPFFLLTFSHVTHNSDRNIKAVLIRGPYLQVATDKSVMIRWRTDVSARSRVTFGTNLKKLDSSVKDFTLVTEHKIKLTNLKPDTKYYYSIGGLKDTLQGDENNFFKTLPVAAKEGFYRIGVFGDCGDLNTSQANVRDEFVKYLGSNYLNAWLLLGDNAYNDGTDAEYQAKFFNVYKDLLKKYPLFPTPGNHDYHDADFTANYQQDHHATAYYQNFSMPINGQSGGIPSHNKAFYSFDLGNIHFISLDSYGKEENKYFLYDTLGPQVQWLKKDLQQNKNKDWVIVYTHFPPYSMGSHNSDNESGLYKIREDLVPILERYGVDLFICGHSHVYERSKLMKGYFGKEADFDSAKYDLSSSSGLYDGSKNSCPYIKDASDKGTIYVVSGSASYVGKPETSFPHAAMYYSNAIEAGAAILEVQENRLDLKWICEDGIIRDHFTIMKNVGKASKIHLSKGRSVKLTASFVSGEYSWNKSKEQGRSIQVKPPVGKTTYTVKDKFNCLKDIFEVEVSK
jgi:hypothetical protein